MARPPAAGLRSSASPLKVLLLAPSAGLGGGIERYVETIEWAFAQEHVDHIRISLDQPGPAAHLRMLRQARRQLRDFSGTVRIVAAHRVLMPVASVLARDRMVDGITVVCHGIDMWQPQLRPRRQLERALIARRSVRAVAASNFTAGEVFGNSRANVLAPGLSQLWFDTLTAARVKEQERRHDGLRLVTAFRLSDWRDKGLPEILDAIESLGRDDISLTVCGSGEPTAELRGLLSRYRRSVARSDLTDPQLAAELASADLFVLATRTRRGRHSYGEGFGLVLLEAQVAGTPVVAPAYGGSHDAYLDGITGVSPVDETAQALAFVLQGLLSDPGRLERMATRAAQWAGECSDPPRYAARATARLI